MLHRIPLRRSLACSLALFALTTVARAQDYWTPEQVAAVAASDAALAAQWTPVVSTGTGTSSFTAFDPLEQLLEEATFLTKHQAMGVQNKGGMREGEALANIIQTDNTTESIWVWSHFRERTGDTRFDTNVDKAWCYVEAHPAWLEEGGGGNTGYYRIYNCAWGLVAEPKYRAATGDTSHLAYAQQCAQYLLSHGLGNGALFTMVKAWAAGALYDFGVEQGNPAYIARAVQLGEEARLTAEAQPSYLALETWAMSGGAILWGVLRSTFQVNPGGKAWAETYAPLLKDWDSSGTWNFASNGWYALGHDAAWEATADPTYLRKQYALQLKLVAKDKDNDGGIPTQKGNTPSEDETWVSNYLMYMGTQRVSEPVDAAAVSDDFSLAPGVPWAVEVTLASQDPVNVLQATAHLELSGPGFASLPVIAPRTLVLAPLGVTPTYAFTVPLGAGPGTYNLTFSGATELGGVVETSSLSVVVQ